MNYEKHYRTLVEKAVLRVKPEGYFEVHHIVPKCLGGGDEASNLVNLTAEEHFIAHQLLAKIHKDNEKLIYAAFAMGNESNRRYGWLKRRHSEHMKSSSNPMKNPESAAKVSAKLKNRVFSKETKQKMSAAKSGEKHFSYGSKRPEHSEIMRGDNNPSRRIEVRMKQSKAHKGKLKPKVACVNCGVLMSAANMKRWHSNCNSNQLLKGADSERARTQRSIS